MTVRLQKMSTRAHGAVPSRLATWTAVGTAALSLLAINAHAQDEDLTQHKIVRYSDLNPSSPADASALYTRLEYASKAVCRPPDGRDLVRMQAQKNCYDYALSNAITSVHKPNVTALYRSDNSIRMAQRASNTHRA